MIKKEWFAQFDKNQRFASISAFFLVWVMVFCILKIFVSVGEQLFPAWSGTYIIWIGMCVSIEAIIVNFLVAEKEEKIGVLYRISEILIIMVILKLVQLIQSDGTGIFLEGLDWNLFLDSFFSGGYLFLLFFLLLIWGLSNAYTRDILAMQSYISDLELGGFIQLRSERINARRQIANAYLAIGLVLIILVSLARLDLSLYEEVVGKALSMPLGISVIPLVIYFLAGLILLSLSQFAILRGGWLMGNVPIAPKVAANWLRYTIIIFGIAGVGIYFLPTDYSINLLQSALFVLQFLFDVILFLMGLFIFPFVYIYSLILSLFGKAPAQDSQPQMPDFELPPDKTPPGVLPPWLELIKNIFFWTILSGGMIYFVWHYIRQNKSWLAGLKWQGFSNWVASLRKWLHQLFPTIQMQIENFIKELGANIKGTKKSAMRENGSRKFNFKKLNSKEKILYFYVSFLEEMDKQGIGKKSSQTPSQYYDQLISTIPQQEEALRILTNGFEEARYSGRTIYENEANHLQKVWKSLINQIKALGEILQ